MAIELVERIAVVLGVPAAYFYAVGDDEAELLLHFHKLSPKRKKQVLEVAGGES